MKRKHGNAGLNFDYNHDLEVSDNFLLKYPEIQKILKDERLIRAFKVYDEEAKKHNDAFHFYGLWSLIFAAVTLLTAALEIIFGGSAVHYFGFWGVMAQAGSVVSVLLAGWNRFAGHRIKWCQALFCRERLRQWHFQLFLDGALLSQINKPDFDQKVEDRWNELQEKLRNGPGLMSTFVRFPSRTDDFFHLRANYTDEPIAQEVFRAVKILRFEHQLSFSRIKLEDQATGGKMSLEERSKASESLASFTLVMAVVVGMLGCLVSLYQHLGLTLPVTVDAEIVSRCLGGSALFLVVLSAASRAYRAGHTLPDEIESYEEYCDRVREFQKIFENPTNSSDVRLRQLEHLEEESIAELRRFLRMKLRATFVF